ncbi:MAG: sulfotransferase [Planctomycetota bacterium]
MPTPKTIDSLALIIGAMKAGTTSLYALLSQHPEICPCAEKEAHFFSRDDRWSRGLGWYYSLWKFDPATHRVALEATPTYASHTRRPEVVDRIAEAQADTQGTFRFIYIMRDPVARIESQLRHRLTTGQPVQRDGASYVLRPFMIDASRYATQLDPYRERFGAASLLLLRFEDLRDDPNALLRRTCAFLGVDPSHTFERAGKRYNESRRNHPIVHWAGSNAIASRMVRAIPAPLRARAGAALARRVEPVTLPESQRESIRTELRDDMRRLREEYGVDTSVWHTAD